MNAQMVKCPKCGQTLSIPASSTNSAMAVQCPKCKTTLRIGAPKPSNVAAPRAVAKPTAPNPAKAVAQANPLQGGAIPVAKPVGSAATPAANANPFGSIPASNVPTAGPLASGPLAAGPLAAGSLASGPLAAGPGAAAANPFQNAGAPVSNAPLFGTPAAQPAVKTAAPSATPQTPASNGQPPTKQKSSSGTLLWTGITAGMGLLNLGMIGCLVYLWGFDTSSSSTGSDSSLVVSSTTAEPSDGLDSGASEPAVDRTNSAAASNGNTDASLANISPSDSKDSTPSVNIDTANGSSDDSSGPTSDSFGDSPSVDSTAQSNLGGSTGTDSAFGSGSTQSAENFFASDLKGSKLDGFQTVSVAGLKADVPSVDEGEMLPTSWEHKCYKSQETGLLFFIGKTTLRRINPEKRVLAKRAGRQLMASVYLNDDTTRSNLAGHRGIGRLGLVVSDYRVEAFFRGEDLYIFACGIPVGAEQTNVGRMKDEAFTFFESIQI